MVTDITRVQKVPFAFKSTSDCQPKPKVLVIDCFELQPPKKRLCEPFQVT